MTVVRLEAPVVGARSATFFWSVTPSTPLYRQSHFTLRFPEAVDLTGLPARLWWTVALLCLHPHWALLRPCRVELPVRLGPGEVEFWRRLVEAAVVTLEGSREASVADAGVDLVESGPALAPFSPLAERGRCATAFSGGKDSLVQAGLLSELTARPLLVTTTSPMPPLHDHSTSRRRQVLREVSRRTGAELVEVRSDLRAIWKNDFPLDLGYRVATNELSDTFLYVAALLVAGVARGVTHLFLASEAEVQENVERHGRVVQHSHFMYSVATQRAVEGLLQPLGVRYGSLTSPLHSGSVLELLWTRYRDLADLQYSCWRVGPTQAACSRCTQCLRLAFGALAAGGSPLGLGVDLGAVLAAQAGWVPRPLPEPGELPNQRVSAELDAQTVLSVQQTSARQVARELRSAGGRRRGEPYRRALEQFALLRRRLAGVPTGGERGVRGGFFAAMDPLLAERIRALYARHFAEEDEAQYRGLLARQNRLTNWLIEPLAARRPAAA